MEVTDANIQGLATYLKGTLDPDVKTRKEAETFLVSIERNKNYPVLLLKLLTMENVELFVRQAAAITFKNYVKRNWEVDAEDNIHAEDRLAIKQLVVELMLQSPEGIQKQLRAAVQIIGKHDFPEHWGDLIKILTQKIETGDFRVINGALQTANSLFKRYRHEMRTDTLFLEIKYVLQEFAPTLTTLFVSTIDLLKTHEKNPEAVKTLADSLLIIAKIFYSLNAQDLAEYFEDNMPTWMPRLCELLSYTNPLLETDSESEPGVLEKFKTEICESVAMYAQKYSEEFEPYLGNFVTAVWNLLTTTSAALKYDYLVGSAISFLASVAYRIQNKALFENDATMGSICEKVIVPNMEFRQCDEELFEDSPEEYIRRDTEGSDQETRRRAACDFVRALSMNFEEKITMIFSQYVNAMLAQYATNPNAEWRRKDAALYLITSLAAKAQTQKSGITKANTLVDVNSFLAQHVLPELNDENIDERPVVKADCLRYVLVFRSVLDPNAVRSAIPAVVKHLADKSVVAHSYAASTIEKILAMPEKIVSAQDLQGVMEPLLKNLFGIFQMDGSSENEYAMQAIMRVLACLGDAVVPILAPLLPTLMGKLSTAVQNPKNPRHNHYLMESLCCSIQAGCKADANAACESFESSLFPMFQEILQKDVTEFVPYVFQILALLLEMRARYKLALPEPYLALLNMLIMPEVWETHGNIPPLSRLLRAFINLGQAQVVTPDRMENFMKLFHRLISSKTFDGEGFNIVQTIMESQFGPELLQPHFKQIFTLIFTRLSKGRTPKFTKHLMVFSSHFAIKFTPQGLIEAMDSLQPGLFGMYLERVVALDLQKVSGNEDRAITAIGLIKLLTSEPMVNGKYADKWGQTFSCLVDFLQLPVEQSTTRNDLELEFGEGSYADPFETNVGYHGSYSRLVFAGRGVKFPFSGQVQDVNGLLASSLHNIRAMDATKLPKLISALPELDAQQKVANFLRGMNIAV